MKKVLALALALVMALSMTAMAFAADPVACQVCGKLYDTAANAQACAKAHTAPEAETEPTTVFRNSCPKCFRQFANEAEYNEHMTICKINDKGGIVDLTVQELLAAFIELAKSSMSQWDAIESVIIRLVDFVEGLGTTVLTEAEVKGALADIASIEGIIGNAEIPALTDLLNAVKQKIKDFYTPDVATTVEETVIEITTDAVEIVDTGSSSVGIAVFAAVSVAAAAAYVCTKKSK